MRLLASLVAVAIGTAGLASAQSSAETLHERGRARAKDWRQTGDRAALEEAARLFKEALALGDSPLIECDLGLALHYLGEESRAHARLTRCMPRLAAVSPDKVAGYRGVEDEVAAAVAKDHVAVDLTSSPPGAEITISSFPADETVLAPTLIWLRPGMYTLTAHVDGHVDVSTDIEITDAEVTARARETWRATLEPKPADVIAPEVRDPEPSGRLVERPARSRTPAYISLAAGGALLAGGGVVHYLGREKREHLATLNGDAYQAYLPTWQRSQRTTIGLYAAGALATGVGAWLYLRAGSPAPIAVSPTPEGDGAMVWVFSASP